MEEIDDFDDTVVAGLDEQSAGDAIQSQSDAGYELEVLRGDHVAPSEINTAHSNVSTTSWIRGMW